MILELHIKMFIQLELTKRNNMGLKKLVTLNNGNPHRNVGIFY
jgi:hypothetical protein